MILSNSAIFEALDAKRLVITPEPSPRDPATDPDADWPYQTSAVDLRLGDEVSCFNDGLAINIDLRRGKFASLFGPNSTSVKLSAAQPYSLAPQKLVLANTARGEIESCRSLTGSGHSLPVLRAAARSLDAACWSTLPRRPFMLATQVA